MARPRKTADDLNIAQSTGAVEFDSTPDEWGVSDDTSSTGAYEMPEQTTFTQGLNDGPVVVNYATPGPVTVVASFLGGAERQVIEAQHAEVTLKTEAEPSEVTVSDVPSDTPIFDAAAAAEPVPEPEPSEAV